MELKKQPDEVLIGQVLSGLNQAFGLLVDRYKNQVAKTVIGMLGKTPEAEDVGQEVFIRL